MGDLRRLFDGPVITNEEMTADDGRRHIESGAADAVAFGRDYIATPDLAERIAVGAALNTPSPSTFYPDSDVSPSVGYTDYPAMPELPVTA